MVIIYNFQDDKNRGTTFTCVCACMCVHAPVEVASVSFSVEKDSKMESSTTLAVVSELLNNNKEKLG